MKDVNKIPKPDRPTKWAAKQAVARGWFEVVRLAERERRKREDGRVLRLVEEEAA